MNWTSDTSAGFHCTCTHAVVAACCVNRPQSQPCGHPDSAGPHLPAPAVDPVALHELVVDVVPWYDQAAFVHRAQGLLRHGCCYAQLFVKAPGGGLVEGFTCGSSNNSRLGHSSQSAHAWHDRSCVAVLLRMLLAPGPTLRQVLRNTEVPLPRADFLGVAAPLDQQAAFVVKHKHIHCARAHMML